ncbi:hypothetical protein BKA67DRAFT_662842 [Truncatella angustata]|uniref:Uncharacterized protein n=1 Tax=Truncatella angustata TaxID=152316 RepID=A0A9P8UDV1_9PEZI|nr:uncharacterized protein BKA67DRAFT_662842 [Truncatella angustata]KAH6648113.1 hypothetical protein BKA67DRAFT_662842 [Truncatella angustata]
MGMATGNSIYAAECLLQDPSRLDRSGISQFQGIRRIIGSLGEPGIVFLVPPPSPRRERLDSVQHRVVRHDAFDGQLVNHFEQTSLHLKLTALKIPLVTAQGAIDADIVICEALVRVFDGPRWMADLDIVRGFEDLNLTILPGCTCSGREDWDGLGAQLSETLGEKLRSISRWEELFLCQENLLPDEIGCVRSSGNWFARLAAMSLALSTGCPTSVFPPGSICRDCGTKLLSWRPRSTKLCPVELNLLIV